MNTKINQIWTCPVCQGVGFHGAECPEENEEPCGPTMEDIAAALGETMIVFDKGKGGA